MKFYLLLLSICLTQLASAQEGTKQFVGVPIDVSSWSYQRAVQFEHAGVVELELDEVVRAHASKDLGDLRIVCMGRQIPFLAIKPGLKHDFAASISEVIDPKAPLLSKWDIKLPSEGFPASELLLESASPQFNHTLTVSEQYETPQGRMERILGTANWQHQPGTPANSCHLVFRTAPQTATLRLATTDTNTPRAQISSARIAYPLVRLIFRVPGTETVSLCYGNPQAVNPRYDLKFNRRDFDSGVKDVATLGPEVKPTAQSLNIHTMAGHALWTWETARDWFIKLQENFDTSNPWHVGGLVVAGLLLLKILLKIFSRGK